MPLCWSVLHHPEWKKTVFQELPLGLAASQDEGQYMLWLGEEALVAGEQGTNLALVAYCIVETILVDCSI
jgi:hypothetical protein